MRPARSIRFKPSPPLALASHPLSGRLCYFLSVDSGLNLNIEIDYLSVIWEFVEYDEGSSSDEDTDSWSSEEFRVVIPVTEVVSARLFDEELYDEFVEMEDEPEEDWE